MSKSISRREFLMSAAVLGAGLLTPRLAQAQSKTFRRIYCPILMYHYVSYAPADADAVLADLTVAPELFSEHLDKLKALGFTSVTMKQFWNAMLNGDPLPEKPVVLTFDDGYADAYLHATPRLLEKGMVGTFYVVSSFMDQPGYLTWGQAVEMRNAGMEIGNHSVSHPNLSGRNDEFLRGEIEGGAAAIASVMGERPVSFCYPMGRYDNNTIRIVRETGHTNATTTSDGTMHRNNNPYRLSRVRVRNTTNVASLEWLVGRQV